MSSPTPLDLKNIQGDILSGLPKKVETYWFFQISNSHIDEFRTQLNKIVPLITTTAECIHDRKRIIEHKKNGSHHKNPLTLSGVNISFSQKGLAKIGISDKIGDVPFEGGMLNDVANLNDQTTSWFPEFKEDIHCLIFITGDSQKTVDFKLAEIKKVLTSTVRDVILVKGNVRPGEQAGHEHFGYLDGVSEPAVLGVNSDIHLGQELVRQGIILLGREGDSVARPSWALDGSFLSFRYLSQLVPEFDAFTEGNNPPGAPTDFLGSRLVGRWKSGAPIDVTPLAENAALGADVTRNNNFRYDPFSQERCPFAAHTRKTNPRSDLATTEQQRIIRRGIPFGPEVSDDERTAGTTQDRGLLFKAYQSNITNGFQFIQKNWANNTNFPFLFTPGVPKPGFDNTSGPGFDAIIGQAEDTGVRSLDIIRGNDEVGKLSLPVQWVISRGGEYFFSPSIAALKGSFALQPESSRKAL